MRALAVVALFACGGPPSPAGLPKPAATPLRCDRGFPDAAIHGTVTTKSDGKPLPDVRVVAVAAQSMGSFEAKTDERGCYFGAVSTGLYTVDYYQADRHYVRRMQIVHGDFATIDVVIDDSPPPTEIIVPLP
jgi:hypothetical protein